MINNFCIYTLGCKVNMYESNIIRNELLSLGYLEVEFNQKSDLYIINTCSVTNVADNKSIYYIKKAKKINPNAILIVMGCFSQMNPHLQKELNIDILLGNKYKTDIVKILDEFFEKKEKINKIKNLFLENKFEESSISSFSTNTRAFIKIQDGCNFMCSYCIIPFSRGKQRSKEPNAIIKEIKNLVKKDYKEIVLTGVNIAGYQFNDINFYNLLCMINDIKGNFRIRISSVEPFQITDDIIDLITENKERFCQQWHICLQSGSDNVLKTMNRKYTTKEFKLLLDKIKNKSPATTFTTDYISCFPTETSDDFINSINFLKEINFLKIHLFPFSKRKNTYAYNLTEINSQEKKERMKQLNIVERDSAIKVLDQYIGLTLRVLFEKKEDDSKYQYGYSDEYIRVGVESDKNLENKLLDVKITKRIFRNLIGEIKNL